MRLKRKAESYIGFKFVPPGEGTNYYTSESEIFKKFKKRDKEYEAWIATHHFTRTSEEYFSQGSGESIKGCLIDTLPYIPSVKIDF